MLSSSLGLHEIVVVKRFGTGRHCAFGVDGDIQLLLFSLVLRIATSHESVAEPLVEETFQLANGRYEPGFLAGKYRSGMVINNYAYW